MRKELVIIERTSDGSYSLYMQNTDYNFGLIGTGDTIDDAKLDFKEAYEEIKEIYAEKGEKVPELEFNFRYDMASFLADYSDKISLAGLGRLTGVNRKQLSHYLTGKSKPKKATVEKIQKALHEFGSELNQVQFI